MADLDSLSIDQQYALTLAATTLHDEFADFFSTATIQRYLETSYDQFAGRAKFTNSSR
jgi:arsenate reductase